MFSLLCSFSMIPSACLFESAASMGCGNHECFTSVWGESRLPAASYGIIPPLPYLFSARVNMRTSNQLDFVGIENDL